MNNYQTYIMEVLRRTGKGIKDYVRAQIIIMAVSFLLLSVALYIIGVSHFILKALLIAIVDVVPILGSGMVMIPWAIVRALSGEGNLAIKLIILYFLLVIARQILEPYIIGKSIGIKPIFTFILAIIGTVLFGPLGAILSAVMAILIKVILDSAEINSYLRQKRIKERRDQREKKS